MNYLNKNGMMALIKEDAKGTKVQKLTNWSAKIKAKIMRISPTGDKETRFRLEVMVENGLPVELEIPFDEYKRLDFAQERVSPSAVFYPCHQYKDHVLAAIGLESNEAYSLTQVETLGWHIIDNKLAYMAGDGPIIARSVLKLNGRPYKSKIPSIDESCYSKINSHGGSVSIYMDSRLDRLGFKAAKAVCPEVIKKAIEELVGLGKGAGSAILGAVTNSILGFGDCASGVIGESDSKKSTLASIGASFYGTGFTEKSPLLTFSSTPNALEKILSITRDTTVVLDDFVLSSSTAEMTRSADLIFQNLGNNGGRMRMSGASGLARSYTLRGNPIVTGEEIPPRMSLNARMIIVSLRRGDVDLESLSRCCVWRSENVYLSAMKNYAVWLVDRKSAIDSIYKKLRLRYRRSLHNRSADVVSDAVNRVEDNYAAAAAAMKIFLRFMKYSGWISKVDELSIFTKFMNEIYELYSKQIEELKRVIPRVQVMTLIKEALAGMKAHISTYAGKCPDKSNAATWGWLNFDGEFRPVGQRIGYVNNRKKEVYLIPSLTSSVVQALAKSSNEQLHMNPKILADRLEPLLARKEKARGGRFLRITINGTKHELLCLPLSEFEVNDSEEQSASDDDEEEDGRVGVLEQEAEKLTRYLEEFLKIDGITKEFVRKSAKKGFVYDRHTGYNTTYLQILRNLKGGGDVLPRLIPKLTGKARELAELSPILAHPMTTAGLVTDFDPRNPLDFEDAKDVMQEELAIHEARVKREIEEAADPANSWSFRNPVELPNSAFGLYHKFIDYEYEGFEYDENRILKSVTYLANILLRISLRRAGGTNIKRIVVDMWRLCRPFVDDGIFELCEEEYYHLSPVFEEEDLLVVTKNTKKGSLQRSSFMRAQAYIARIYDPKFVGDIRTQHVYSSVLSSIEGMSGVQVDIMRRYVFRDDRPDEWKYGIYEVRLSGGPVSPAFGSIGGLVWRFVDWPLTNLQ